MADALPAEDFTLNYEEIKMSYSKSDDAGDSFDFTATPVEQKVGMLLPAVQQVREPSPLPPDVEDQAIDSFKFGPAKDDGKTAYEYKLDGVMISNYDVNGAGDSGHDEWIDVLSIDWGMDRPAAEVVKEAGLRSDGELVQAVSEADMGGDFIF